MTGITNQIRINKTSSPKPRPSETDLGFGRFFADHMFMVDYSKAKGWNTPRIEPYQALSLDPGASVLHYGQAIFEGMKAFRGSDGRVRLFRPEMNWKRMCTSADRLCMKFIEQDLFIESLKELVRTEWDWIPSRDGTALYLRPTLIGTEGFLGVRPSDNFLYYVISSPVGSYYAESKNLDTVKIWVETHYARAAPGGIGASKAGGNYAASLLAAMEAKKRGFAQVLWLDASGHKQVEEVGTMNVFFRIKDHVITPPLSGTILPGVMRDSVIQLLEARGQKVEQRPIDLNEIISAHAEGDLQEVFGTGTAASISPVGALGFEDRTIEINSGKTGPIAAELFKSIQDIQYGRAPDKLGWTMEVAPPR